MSLATSWCGHGDVSAPSAGFAGCAPTHLASARRRTRGVLHNRDPPQKKQRPCRTPLFWCGHGDSNPNAKAREPKGDVTTVKVFLCNSTFIWPDNQSLEIETLTPEFEAITASMVSTTASAIISSSGFAMSSSYVSPQVIHSLRIVTTGRPPCVIS